MPNQVKDYCFTCGKLRPLSMRFECRECDAARLQREHNERDQPIGVSRWQNV